MANIKSVWDSNKGDKESEKKNEFFSGGGAQSGTGVLRPVKKDENGNGNGPSEVDVNAFLQQMQAAQQAQGLKADASMDDAIVIYKNGFKIGTGDFRPASDPKNKKFLEELKAGSLPKELEPVLLEKLGPNAKNVGVNVVNRSHQDFEAPAEPKFQAFKGQGHSLGGGKKEDLDASFETCEAKEIDLVENGDTTKIQVVLYNNKRVTITVNLNNTILQLYAHVKAISQIEANFDLLAGFPPKPLSDPKATIESAGLKGSRVQQKARK